MKSDWLKLWVKQSERINALSLRERAILFLLVTVGCAVLVDALWLSPAQLKHKQLTLRFTQQSAELQRSRDTLKALAQPVDKAQALRADLAAVKTRLEDVNQNINVVMPTAGQASPLAEVLVHLLRQHQGLKLVRTLTLPPEAAPAKAAATAAAAPALTRQGVELTVSGPYADLMRYVQSLEQALPYVRWGLMRLKSETLPPELTLQLYLIGLPS